MHAKIIMISVLSEGDGRFQRRMFDPVLSERCHYGRELLQAWSNLACCCSIRLLMPLEVALSSLHVMFQEHRRSGNDTAETATSSYGTVL